ncbi:MAG TPA: hypothetical protein VHC92_08995 [Rhodanobacteraceae bacterium]|nr:hypothetical protein [Rhodanobacteraceae bacterium]
MKRFALAGLSETERTELTRLLARAGTTLDEPWSLLEGDGRADLVVIDPEQFAGRVARVRALGERTNFAVIVDADAESPEAWLVLRRPLTTEALVDMFNRAACCDRSGTDENVAPQTAEVAVPEAQPESARASFETPRGPRTCTDFNTLVQRGTLVIERPGLPRLVVDPAAGTYHANGSLSRLEPYFLDPLKPSEYRQLPSSRLDEIRAAAPGRPIVQLQWLGAMLRSNGCLGTHLDPGGTFKVQRWMSIYGEYRKQYRIATMMLRPLRLHEIARKADAKMTEVFDVVNAYDAVGLLEWEPRKSRYAEAERPRTPVPGKRRLLAAALLAR